MSAEVLRVAAALMRARAEAVTSPPDPEYKVWGQPHPESWQIAVLTFAGEDGYPKTRSAPGAAEHFTSWSPVVAVAVADWLDAEAEAHLHVGKRVKAMYDMPGMETSPAMRVALAYLGDDTP